jgi:hypothetical protein
VTLAADLATIRQLVEAYAGGSFRRTALSALARVESALSSPGALADEVRGLKVDHDDQCEAVRGPICSTGVDGVDECTRCHGRESERRIEHALRCKASWKCECGAREHNARVSAIAAKLDAQPVASAGANTNTNKTRDVSTAANIRATHGERRVDIHTSSPVIDAVNTVASAGAVPETVLEEDGDGWHQVRGRITDGRLYLTLYTRDINRDGTRGEGWHVDPESGASVSWSALVRLMGGRP